MAARLLPLQPFTFSLHSSHSHPSLTFCSHSRCPFIGNNGAAPLVLLSTKVAANSSSSSTKVAANLWHLGWVHMQWQQPNTHLVQEVSTIAFLKIQSGTQLRDFGPEESNVYWRDETKEIPLFTFTFAFNLFFLFISHVTLDCYVKLVKKNFVRTTG